MREATAESQRRGRRVGAGASQERVKALLAELVIVFFSLTPNYITSAELVDLSHFPHPQENTGVQYAVGSAVTTPQGAGVITAYDPQSKLYSVAIGESEVQLPRKDLLVETAEERSSEDDEETTPAGIASDAEEKEETEVPVQVEVEGRSVCVA